MKAKPQSGKSRDTKVVSVRIPNKEHALLVKKANGKKKLTSYVRSVLIEEALS